MSERHAPQGRCADIAADGLAGYAGYFPQCFWSDECKVRGCFWRGFHQLGEPDSTPKQGALDI